MLIWIKNKLLKPNKYIYIQVIVKHREESETLPYLQTKNLACHSFMAAGRWYEIPRTEIKDNFLQ